MTITQKLHARLLSLDVFRGLTIVGMILVNSPGNNTAYHFLVHSVWHGCTPADCVFPFFIFIVGVSLVISLSKRLAQGAATNSLLLKVLYRAMIIFLLGLFLNGFPHYHLATLRIFGVLQRIAICYFFAALLFLKTSTRVQLFITFALLIIYWLLMTNINVPGHGVNDLSVNGNLETYIDNIFLSGHLYTATFDPEGLLSTLPAIATALIGNLTGIGLLSRYSPEIKLKGLFSASLIALVAGWLWGLTFPINKSLWTSSFVLWESGLALFLFAVCYWLIEIKHVKRWSTFFEIFGLNALAAYLCHILLLKIQNLIHVHQSDGSTQNIRLFITDHLFGWTSHHNASLLYAISYVLLWFIVLWLLYRKKIFIRI